MWHFYWAVTSDWRFEPADWTLFNDQDKLFACVCFMLRLRVPELKRVTVSIYNK